MFYFPFGASYCQASKIKDFRETPLKLSKVWVFPPRNAAVSEQRGWPCHPIGVPVSPCPCRRHQSWPSAAGPQGETVCWCCASEGEEGISMKMVFHGILNESLPLCKSNVVCNFLRDLFCLFIYSSKGYWWFTSCAKCRCREFDVSWWASDRESEIGYEVTCFQSTFMSVHL